MIGFVTKQIIHKKAVTLQPHLKDVSISDEDGWHQKDV